MARPLHCAVPVSPGRPQEQGPCVPAGLGLACYKAASSGPSPSSSLALQTQPAPAAADRGLPPPQTRQPRAQPQRHLSTSLQTRGAQKGRQLSQDHQGLHSSAKTAPTFRPSHLHWCGRSLPGPPWPPALTAGSLGRVRLRSAETARRPSHVCRRPAANQAQASHLEPAPGSPAPSPPGALASIGALLGESLT